MKKFFKNPSGFTLVELMVVVAIIGILSAIAVPNFKKYQAKSKQSEAKIQLAAVYNSEVGTLADYDTYATCLPKMGYEQTPRGYYIVGFLTGLNASGKFSGCTSGGINAAGAAAVDTDRIVAPLTTQLAVVTANRPVTLTTPSTATQTTFIAAAEGSISSSTTRPVDKWTISETKALLNPVTGY